MKKYFWLLLFVFMFACDPQITDGTVYDKKFVPAHTYTHTHSTPHFIGKMIYYTYYTSTDYIPDTYYISFKKYSEKDKEWLTRTMKADKEFYDKTKIGSYIDVTPKEIKNK